MHVHHAASQASTLPGCYVNSHQLLFEQPADSGVNSRQTAV